MPEQQREFGVLLDASTLRGEQAGVKSYVLGLARALTAEERVRLHVAAAPRLGLEELNLASFQVLGEDLRHPLRRALWRERSLERLARRCGASRILIPVHEMPMRRLPVPVAMVILDVGPLVAPALYGRARWLRYAATLPRSCKVADAIVCLSEATRLAVHQTLGVPADRLHVIGTGPQPFAAVSETAQADVARREAPLFLYVGSALRHKNLRTLVAAFGRPSAPRGRLVMVGPAYSETDRREIQKLRSSGAQVEHRGFVSVEELSELYAAATCVVLPTLYEGFGMPILEAFQARVPIVASAVPALEEVAGDAAYFVRRPLDPGAWSTALTRVAMDDALRALLVERGTARLREHSWSAVGSRWVRLLAGMQR